MFAEKASPWESAVETGFCEWGFHGWEREVRVESFS